MIAKSINIRYNASNHEHNFQFNSWGIFLNSSLIVLIVGVQKCLVLRGSRK